MSSTPTMAAAAAVVNNGSGVASDVLPSHDDALQRIRIRLIPTMAGAQHVWTSLAHSQSIKPMHAGGGASRALPISSSPFSS
mmetsp:Transcript_2445/g.5243  ORF Transcript_2445/g.5243 Transcript_2445/m.5243 type:complete len:82 (-) Transcript_2445:107-352(-)